MTSKNLVLSLALTLALSLVMACASSQGPTKPAYQGSAAGAAVGAAAGAMLDSDNSWRGGVIGGALGAVLGGALGEIGSRASQEAAYSRQPVAYSNQAGTQRVEAYPKGRRGQCQIVKEKFYENGKLTKVVEREICN